MFVGWLMNFPTGHASCASWEMPSSLYRRHTLGEHLPRRMDLNLSNLEKDNDRKELPAMREGVPRRTTAEQILREDMPAQISPNGARVRPNGPGLRTPIGDGTLFGSGTYDQRTRTPQEREQAGQPHRKSGSIDDQRTHEFASIKAPEAENLPELRESLYSPPSDPRSGEDLLKGVPLPALGTLSAQSRFQGWMTRMRGALSALPTASAAWIWKPPAKTKAQPEQRSLFDD